MDTSAKGLNVKFPIYKADGTSFEDLVLHKSAFESVVMSLGDKITGDVYYKNNSLVVTMQEYIVYEGVHYVLVNPPTIVREGLVKDNSEAKGLTKYSFTFYHPMYMLGNFEFTDVAVEEGEERYLAQNKTFSWIGYLRDFVDKLNANLANTQWIVRSNVSVNDDKLSEVLSFDNNFVSDALKTAYETWKKPFTIQQLLESDADYNNGKRFAIVFGMPDERVIVDGEEYTFRLGQGVGLKNNSRTPKNNKIVTRISGYGSENNIPWGYPQIIWTGDSRWEFTKYIGEVVYDEDDKPTNDPAPDAYPIYNGIVNGQQVRLIKHPFTRNHLMPSVYRETVDKKVNPLNPNYNPQTPIIDYYDAIDDIYTDDQGNLIEFPNNIDPQAPSYEIHQFEDIKPELGNNTTLAANAVPYTTSTEGGYVTVGNFNTFIGQTMSTSTIAQEKDVLSTLVPLPQEDKTEDSVGGAYTYKYEVKYLDDYFLTVKYESSGVNFVKKVLYKQSAPTPQWDDTMDDDGNYAQSYFKLTLPQLSFDLYACASITEEMKINMRSGACIGCTFPIMVDWEDYKKNFYDDKGNFVPYSDRRNYDKYPDSTQGSITVICQKEYETFGTIMPNVYQQPKQGDIIVFLGISLPQSYIDDAEERLDEASIEYMLENNVHLYEYPLKFDEYFLKNNLNILQQIHNNTRIKFQFGGEVPMALFVKQINIKWGDNILPQYDITLADDIEVVLNQIGQVTEDVSALRVQMSEMQKYYAQNLINDISSRLSRIQDDIALGKITFQQGLESIGSLILHSDIRSDNYIQGMTTQGRGWRIDELGNAEVESIRVRSFMEIMELLVNRLQAQEGDTAFTDNDQIDYVEEIEEGGTTYYRLTFKDKWNGYVTSQKKGNILKGVANTLAANYANVSDVDENAQGVSYDGNNSYYTSWMQVIRTHNEDNTLGSNQVVVSLYADNLTPADKNFPPCELMTIIRWGHVPQQGESAEEIARLQRSFVLSNTDGRITKLVGVNTPKLTQYNYGTTLGTLPDWILRNYQTVADRYQAGRDYLYAQGIVVEDFIKIDANHQIVIDYIDKGTWTTGQHYVVADPEQGILETHDVWYEGQGWRCKQTNDSNSNNYPQKDSAYWELLVKKGENGTSFSSKGTAIGHYADFTTLEQDLPTIQPTENDLFILDTSNDYYESAGGEEHTGYNAPTVMRFINAPDFIWEAIEATEGDGYMVNNHLFVANDTNWSDMGNIQGAKGDDGQSAFAVELDSNVDTIEADLGSTVRDYRKTIHIRAYYGNTNVLSACTITWVATDPDIEISRIGDAITIEVGGGTALSPTNTITFTVAHPTYGNRTVMFNLNTVEKGQDGTNGQDGQKGDKGDQGKMGKNYYYGGVFDTSRQDTFTANDQETPYFVYGNNKWVYIGENFTNYNLTRIRDEKCYPFQYPNDNGNWQIMVTDFKYLISEAVFSNFARLGSWIFNQDYQFSNQGSGDYASFDAGGRYYGKDSPDNNYIPNIVFNAQTGEGHFAGGNFAWDNQGQVFTRGGFRSPFVYVENEADYQNNFRDNILTESSVAYGWFTLPCSPAQSGRRVTVINHKLKSGDLTDRGTQIRLPNGYYFYEDGIKKTKLSFGRDGIELLGYGNETEFWGWIVLRRFYMETKRAYGHPLDILAMGRVCYLDNWTFVGYTFDGRTLTVEDMSYVGDYFRIHLPSGWFNNSMQASGVFYPQVQVSGVNPDKPTIASIKEIRWNYIDIWYKDLQGNRPNGGGFSISIANRYAWEMLNFDDY